MTEYSWHKYWEQFVYAALVLYPSIFLFLLFTLYTTRYAFTAAKTEALHLIQDTWVKSLHLMWFCCTSACPPTSVPSLRITYLNDDQICYNDLFNEWYPCNKYIILIHTHEICTVSPYDKRFLSFINFNLLWHTVKFMHACSERLSGYYASFCCFSLISM